MTKEYLRYNYYLIPLLFCIFQLAGINAFGQKVDRVALRDSLINRQGPQARARRNRDIILPDSAQLKAIPTRIDTIITLIPDSLASIAEELSIVADSIDLENQRGFEELQSTYIPPIPKDTVIPQVPQQVWLPSPSKATWYAVVFPGGGQIYNRKYWKLPIIYGGFAGCAYALSWNGKMYKDYSQAYLDIMDDDPNTNSHLDLLPNRVSNYSESQLADIIKRRKDTFRRYRDLSIFAIIGVYLISIIDAYVDAELSNFDITPDLSMRVEPVLFDSQQNTRNKSVGVQWSFRF